MPCNGTSRDQNRNLKFRCHKIINKFAYGIFDRPMVSFERSKQHSSGCMHKRRSCQYYLKCCRPNGMSPTPQMHFVPGCPHSFISLRLRWLIFYDNNTEYQLYIYAYMHIILCCKLARHRNEQQLPTRARFSSISIGNHFGEAELNMTNTRRMEH